MGRADSSTSRARLAHSAGAHCRLDPLESRCHLSVTAAVTDGVLRVTGDNAANTIRVAPAAAGVQVTADGQDLGTFPGISSVYVDGGDNDDHLTAAANLARPITLSGGSGDDALLALSPATLAGGDGTDAFWAGQTSVAVADASPTEAKRGINRLPTTFSAAPVATPTQRGPGAAAKDPKITRNATSTADFSSFPLFASAGPSADDLRQGNLNDCYLLAALGSVANTDPSVIYQTITPLGDGTYAVRIMHGKTAKYYDVDADLPVAYGDSPAYAGLGGNNVLWVALIEKAFAIDRGGSYAKLDTGGWMGGVYQSLGLATKTVAATSLSKITAALAANQPVTLATKLHQSGESPLISNHAYTVESIQLDARGHLLSLTIKNPWGLAGLSVGDELTINAIDARGLSAFALGIM